jgi:hypothetical protein
MSKLGILQTLFETDISPILSKVEKRAIKCPVNQMPQEPKVLI